MATLDEYKIIRTRVLTSIFRETKIAEKFALKGGTALDIGYNMPQGRYSSDIDLSMNEDIPGTLEDVKEVFKVALERNLSEYDLFPIDVVLKRNPKRQSLDRPRHGGYILKFFLVKYSDHQSELKNKAKGARSRVKKISSPENGGKFKIDISKYDFWEDDMISLELVDDFTVPMYTLNMIMYEKIKAICEQVPKKGTKSRAKDYYDVFIIHNHLLDNPDKLDHALGSEECRIYMSKCFESASLDLDILDRISEARDSHKSSFEILRETLREPYRSELKEFDFYAGYVEYLVLGLKSSWDI